MFFVFVVNSNSMYDLAIIGGGPAGVAAGVYAARKRLKTVFIAEVIGGQSMDSVEIQNWIGTEKIRVWTWQNRSVHILRPMLATRSI